VLWPPKTARGGINLAVPAQERHGSHRRFL
jgi:hypothetical protein